ncbi:hypothetical protein [Williamsia sp. 1135]|uniref:hypothetical protein n=1 Tax=Williamsia sp. 1135 TaxID=1889262 RepID=UPI00117C7B07|nr:hypothetical protein [Williamsia sp. 1135]
MKVGTWPASTGPVTFTKKDISAAVGAATAPGFRRPIIKLGHVDPRFDGEPALGYVDNIRASADGSTLLGDYRGVPSWLAGILGSAYPDRSIEGQFSAKDATGAQHKFALTAVALLGVTPPAVSGLKTIEDVARLYDVAASTQKGVTITMSNHVAASDKSVTNEHIITSFYDGPGADDWLWIEMLRIQPPEVIAFNDKEGQRYRIGYTINGTQIAWAEPELVRTEFVAASSFDRAAHNAHTEALVRIIQQGDNES